MPRTLAGGSRKSIAFAKYFDAALNGSVKVPYPKRGPGPSGGYSQVIVMSDRIGLNLIVAWPPASRRFRPDLLVLRGERHCIPTSSE